MASGVEGSMFEATREQAISLSPLLLLGVALQPRGHGPFSSAALGPPLGPLGRAGVWERRAEGFLGWGVVSDHGLQGSGGPRWVGPSEFLLLWDPSAGFSVTHHGGHHLLPWAFSPLKEIPEDRFSKPSFQAPAAYMSFLRLQL